MNAWWSTCAVSTNGCPPNANPKHEICDHLPVRIDPVARHPSDVMASLPARRVQARIVELQGGVADRCMDLAAVDAGSVDAGLRKFIPSVLAALVDEYVVVDAAGDDVKLGMRDMSCGELGVVLGRRLGIARADRDVGRHGRYPGAAQGQRRVRRTTYPACRALRP